MVSFYCHFLRLVVLSRQLLSAPLLEMPLQKKRPDSPVATQKPTNTNRSHVSSGICREIDGTATLPIVAV